MEVYLKILGKNLTLKNKAVSESSKLHLIFQLSQMSSEAHTINFNSNKSIIVKLYWQVMVYGTMSL